MINQTTLIGRLTKDVDMRYSQQGKAVSNFNLAVNRPFKNQNGEYDADFINIVQFGKGAEITANYMRKGSQVGISGRIQSRKYENKEGKTVFVTEVVADQVAFLDSKKQNNESSNQSNPFGNQAEPVDISDEILPF